MNNQKQNRGRHRNNARRSNPSRQNFDSNGPGVRIRGSATQVYEKYIQLARDAQTAGDPVMAESMLQYAEHYYRVLNENPPPRPQQSQNNNPAASETQSDQNEGDQNTDTESASGETEAEETKSASTTGRGRGRRSNNSAGPGRGRGRRNERQSNTEAKATSESNSEGETAAPVEAAVEITKPAQQELSIAEE